MSTMKDNAIDSLNRSNGFMILPFISPLYEFCGGESRRDKEPSGEEVLRLIQDPFDLKPLLQQPARICLVRRRLIFM